MTPDQEQEILRRILAGMATRTPSPAPTRTPEPSFPPLDPELLAQLSQFIFYAIIALSLIVVVAIAARAIIRRARRPKAEVEAEQVEPERRIEEATQHAEEGDMRLAMRKLYLAALAILDLRGVLRFDPALTNREIARAVRPRPDLEGALMPVIDVYDPVWYGHKSVSAGEFEAFKRGIQTTLNLAEPEPQPAGEGPA